ncbi:hypothetical protein [Streptodolium elevatio]|uniref:Uncharacterized protein n=1 Tax=Streptodolium elevatio TaxID=3157996 RepID=A0ABV3DNX6_9ACTN
MAVFGVGRGRARDKEAVPGPVVLAPRRGLDGWTLDGTPLAFRFGREQLRELATLMHGVSAGMETPYTYERAADLLEKGGERPQALAVLDAYFMLPAHIRDANPSETRSLGRRRQRLRKRLGTPPPNFSAADEATAVASAEERAALEQAPAPTPVATPEPVPEPGPAPQFTRGILSPEPDTAAKPELPAATPLSVPPKPTVPPPMPASEPGASEAGTSEPGAPEPGAAEPPKPPAPPVPPPTPPANPVIPPRPTRSATPTAPPEGRR